ncbi:M23 family metallopeptidase [Gordonia sp. PDNC005]|uniref:M23 family metallopeptidase n=1 Tax=Gordonia sp. PDNC005 TaxID=2811424 RepID=UPI001F06195F|nr:M23 family metallopeptidase [Gordonia sp. PDNC005]
MRGRRVIACLIAAVVVGATAAGSAGSRVQSQYNWPLAPRPSVTRGFDPPERHWESGHRGVDLASPADAAVLAARAGTVQFAGPVGGRPVISILHADGVTTTYEPVTPRVRRGDPVGRGEVIGVLLAGHPDCSAAACLHWGARRGDGHDADYLNPLGLLGVLRVRLKPLTPEDGLDRAPPGAARR